MTDAPESTTGRRSLTLKRRFLWKLRQKWKLLGLFEINGEHEFYDLTCMLKVGLRAAIQEAIDNPPVDALSDADCKVVLKQAHEGFEMRTYGGPAFAHFRHSLGISEKEYQLSLSSQSFYLQFISNSKSKADFFLTNNKCFFLKTQSKREIRFLLSNLPKYIQHLERYPHSLLVKFLGVHSIIVAQEKKKYFIIMQSVFYPDERILERYDIKGCQVNRWTEPAPEGSQVIVVLKDLNFEGNSIQLASLLSPAGQQRSWLLRQVQLDTQFLKELNVLDYSLLVAFQPLHADEKGQNLSFADIIFRTTMSLSNPESSLLPSVSGIAEEESDILVSEMVAGVDLYRLRELNSGVEDVSLPSSARSDRDLARILAQNRRLLPRCKSPLHLLDGPEFRYFMGIIDLFTVYSFRKRLEHLWKCIRYRGQTFSTVSPSDYARRLCQWVESHTV
ncbi:phosphatidylinositol 4-phosphate 5-kinase-like protein 1 isoform X1 [Mauremys reevesii]|uniref:phosphatidylinositol 4-phosphate 5-kinase-like protein 1 isoform X1 n=1 Tax=Mauremys reevesii TaxID=260615 RepID=UPI00193EE0FF|nr:phosphatidylinositol 4-phosphate 5-kinase-like protein 1 isoform X1 [Mauremys reevesii]XP_039362963.1 phosphatidylinositol 4-phosphate 5-kinase-like protein 1 isoform X1 [Mauremys reevesii]XP_039362964.1 phosphatidylinositol 4-phosphate 5-kinase-like protein 1 isoform X1 [Mauremys reevesii]XP_039362965.1 phosphatidylinositol 4-phosphate 5-kinase-like protein 1 isoform X1 [Mauremys reevesii]